MAENENIESTRQVLIHTVWPFILIVLILLSAALISLEVMSSIRAYVGGESLYSKAQKQAHISLVNYIRSGSEAAYQSYLDQIAIPLGDQKARTALQQSPANLKQAHQGFFEAQNEPDDIPGMIRLFRYFSHTPIMEEPINIWTQADTYIAKIHALSKKIHYSIQKQALTSEVEAQYIYQLNKFNDKITPLEEAFSRSLAKVSVQIETIISILLIIITCFLMGLGIIFSYKLSAQRVKAMNSYQQAARENLAFLRSASDGIHIIALDGNIQEVSDSFCNMLGYSREELIHMNIRQLDRGFSSDVISKMLKEIDQNNSRTQFTTRHRCKDDKQIDVEVSVIPIESSDGRLLFCSSRDISERKLTEQKIEKLAYHDQLTGLSNRASFQILLTDALTQSQKHKSFGAILFIDLDKFKNINDVYGHGMGDELLKEVAKRLKESLRSSDTVFRIGGDEFIILLSELSPDYEEARNFAESIAEKIRKIVARPIRINQVNHKSTASIGISMFPKNNGSLDNILYEADMAMYRSKKNGRNSLTFFESEK